MLLILSVPCVSFSSYYSYNKHGTLRDLDRSTHFVMNLARISQSIFYMLSQLFRHALEGKKISELDKKVRKF